MPSMRKGTSAISLSRRAAAQRAVARPATRATVHFATGSQAVKCLTALSGATLTKRVSIWTSSPGLIGFMPLGRRLAWRWDAQAAWTGFATKHRHGRDDASRHELRQDAPDHRDRDVDPLPAQEDGELALAPHRMISAQPLDLAHESAGPSRLTLPLRPSRARLEPLLPTVERGPARPTARAASSAESPRGWLCKRLAQVAHLAQRACRGP